MGGGLTFSGEKGMGGASLECCRICSNSIQWYTDYIEGTLCESEVNCESCRMYYYSFSYGFTSEVVGMVLRDWNHSEPAPTDWIEIEEEARTIYRSEVGYGLYRTCEGNPTCGLSYLVFADWCAENNCPLNEAEVRRRAKEEMGDDTAGIPTGDIGEPG